MLTRTYIHVALTVVLALPCLPRELMGQVPDGSGVIGRCLSGNTGPGENDQLRVLVEQCGKALAEKSLRSDYKAEILVNRGVAYRNLNDLKRSLRDLDEAIRLSPRSPIASRMRAWTLREMRQSRAAEVEYGRALKLEQHWQAYLSRCVVRIDLRKYKTAREDCEKALTLERNADSLYFTAVMRSADGDATGAISLLEEASLSDQAPARVFMDLANAYIRTGERGAARRSLNEGLSRFPDDRQIKALSDTLDD